MRNPVSFRRPPMTLIAGRPVDRLDARASATSYAFASAIPDQTASSSSNPANAPKNATICASDLVASALKAAEGAEISSQPPVGLAQLQHISGPKFMRQAGRYGGGTA
ncbi:hypothetical protein AAC691_07995 [Nguyenibacter vanlangensis]|uniref:Uncharacterized protein n=1 Tax=Nguyenibacter vanlangensis TaxID=1216886 RepID=A0ABZ3D9C3_9PROT